MSQEVLQNKYKITIDGTDYTKYVPMPIKWACLLDERLDEGRLSMRNVPVELFEPLSKVVITLTDKNNATESVTFLVSDDDAAEVPVGSGHYNHEISLIEETKALENVIISSLSFTNALGRNYTDDAKAAIVVWED